MERIHQREPGMNQLRLRKLVLLVASLAVGLTAVAALGRGAHHLEAVLAACLSALGLLDETTSAALREAGIWVLVLCGSVGAWLGRRYHGLHRRAHSLQLECSSLRETAARDRSLLENGSEIGLLLDGGGIVRHAGPSLERVLGRSPEMVYGKPFLELAHPDDAIRLGAFLVGLDQKPGIQAIETRLRGRDGDWEEFEVLARPGWGDPAGDGVLVCCRDISRRKRAEHGMRLSEERYALAARGANDGLWDWHLERNRVYYSPRWKVMLGYEEGDLTDDPAEWIQRIHPADVDRVKAEIQSHVEGRANQLQCEYRLFHRDGSYRWMLCRGLAVVDGTGRPCRIVGSQTDITARKAAESRLEYAALHDELTGLPNRVLFQQWLTRAMERGSEHAERQFAVLYVDLDRFKVVNDSLGHHSGDQLLSSFARRVMNCVRTGDLVARLGGDEFAILLEGVRDLSDATAVADRIQEELRFPFDLGEQEVYTSASIGIATSALCREHPDDLLRDADTAMYEAKSLGKARYALFDARMHARVTLQLELENDLRRALEREELGVHFQPIISLRTGAITGFEALVRWHHPERGLLYPDAFIPLAEENGLILAIDRWVLLAACCQLREWQQLAPASSDLTMSVNISGRRLAQPGLCQEIARALEESGLDGSRLQLELTETAVIENPEQARRALEELRAMDVGVAIDDFGTGHSSLSSLHQFPFDTLKIDRSFLSAGETDPRKWEVIQTIVTLAHSLRMQVVIEGVETVSQFARVQTLACDYAQGYYFSRPVDSVAASALLSRGRSLAALPRPPVPAPLPLSPA